MTTLERLIQAISRLPGLGKKSATRLAYYFLDRDRSDVIDLAHLLATLHETTRKCSVCGNYTEDDPCSICTDAGRDRSTICVVEHSQDVAALEASHEYQGLYHVLGGVIAPIEGVGPGDLAIAPLVARCRESGITEVIIATNPTVEGDTTALYVAKQLEPLGVSVSRLALGLPVGGDLEYADRLTLARSLRGRTAIGERG